MARDIHFDMRIGSGSPIAILQGTVEITGSKVRENGTVEVVTLPTTLTLSNGQATLSGAQETDGTWFYQVFARSYCWDAHQFRKYLPAGAGTAEFVSLPDAWNV